MGRCGAGSSGVLLHGFTDWRAGRDPAEVEQLANTVDDLMNNYAKAGADTIH